MSHKDITLAAVRAWMSQYTLGQKDYSQYLSECKAKGLFWGAV